MTPKEKAEELIDKMTMEIGKFNSKQCALIAVDEILLDDMYDMGEEPFEKRIDYWQEVKQEIEKL